MPISCDGLDMPERWALADALTARIERAASERRRRISWYSCRLVELRFSPLPGERSPLRRPSPPEVTRWDHNYDWTGPPSRGSAGGLHPSKNARRPRLAAVSGLDRVVASVR